MYLLLVVPPLVFPGINDAGCPATPTGAKNFRWEVITEPGVAMVASLCQRLFAVLEIDLVGYPVARPRPVTAVNCSSRLEQVHDLL